MMKISAYHHLPTVPLLPSTYTTALLDFPPYRPQGGEGSIGGRWAMEVVFTGTIIRSLGDIHMLYDVFESGAFLGVE